jgi:hypothetical protein
MSVLSGIGQLPPVFSGTTSVLTPPISLSLGTQNQGNSSGGSGNFESFLIPWSDYLQSNTTYKVFFYLSVISGDGNAQYAQLGSFTNVQLQFNSPTGLIYEQNINSGANVCMGTLIVTGTITTPNLTTYNQMGELNVYDGWTYPTDPLADLYTAGLLYFEPV